MTREEIAVTVKNLIADLIEMNPETISADANFVDDLGLDSLRALEILAQLEEKFDIEIPEEKLTELTTINSAVDITVNVMGDSVVS